MFKSKQQSENRVSEHNDHLNIEEKISLLEEKYGFDLKTYGPEETDEVLRKFNPKIVDTSFSIQDNKEANRTIRMEKFSRSIYMDGIECVRSTVNLSDLEFSLENMESIIDRSYDICTSSIAGEVSSSSPSMVLHQMATITFSLMINKGSIFEQTCGNYTADLEIKNDDGSSFCILDTCASLNNKQREMDSKGIKKYILLNKYAIISPINSNIRAIIEMSRSCDSRNMDYIYQKVENQASGSEMIYSKATLDFLSKERFHGGRDDLITLRNICKEVMISRMMIGTDQLLNQRHEDIRSSALTSKESLLSALSVCDSDYESISYSDLLNNIDVSDSRNLKDEDSLENIKGNYYEKITHVHIEAKFKDGTIKDTRQLCQKDLRELYTSMSLKELIKNGILPSKIAKIFEKTASRKMGLTLCKESKQLKTKDRFRMLEKFCDSTIAIETYRVRKTEFLQNSLDIDPLHLSIMTEMGTLNDLNFLFSRSREYNDLRMRERVARALYTCRKPESKIRVLHWITDKVYAECYIRGLLFEKDKGIAIVSFFDSGNLMKTEKWRLSDVEAYNKGADTLVSCMCGLIVKSKSVNYKIETSILVDIFRLYSKMITENSWSVGSFMKPFRYWTSGVCMRSTELEKTSIKVIKTICDSNRNKYSLRLVRDFLLKRELSLGETALFHLPFSMIGFECFAVNLTPSKTYGSKRHLRGCITDLVNEINLSNEYFNSIKRVISHFEDIIDEGNFLPENKFRLKSMVEFHFDLIDSLSWSTGGRFTLSPISIVMISESLDKIPRSLYQRTVPHISELMTTKGSWDSINSESCMALKSISHLMVETRETSTTGLLYKILSSENPIDLYMRMFDKDQVAANREISILSSAFRILQSIAEQFSRSIGKETGVDMLDNKRKIRILSESFEESLRKKNRILLTIDQTRWGPNFNTSLFGWMHCYLLRRTTESYIPMLVCLLSEFKVFGSPEELTEIYFRSDTAYSNLGYLGRFHMAQGIFHYTSSLYHGMVNTTMSDLMSSVFQRYEISRGYTLNCSNLVTSDDAAMIMYAVKQEKRRFQKIKEMKDDKKDEGGDDEYNLDLIDLMRKISKVMMKSYSYFNILTSEYKNIISETEIEFNSFYLSENSIGSNDLKYTVSLLLNQTTGSFWEDFRNCINSYGDSVNSGCIEKNAELIMRLNLARLTKMWRLDCPIDNIDPEHMRKGFPRFSEATDSNFSFGDKSRLRFKTRSTVTESMIMSRDIITELVNSKLSKISKSKKSNNYKTLFIPSLSSKPKRLLIQNPYYKNDDVFIDMETCLRVSLIDRDSIYEFYDKENEIPYKEYFMESDYQEGRIFTMKTLTKSMDGEDSKTEILVSSYDRVDHITKGVSDDELILHLLRKYHRLIVNKTDMDLVDKFIELSTITELNSKGSISSFEIKPKGKRTYKTLCYSRMINEGDDEYLPRLRITINPNLSLVEKENSFKTNYLNYFGTVTVHSYGFSQKQIETGFNESPLPSVEVDLDIDMRDLNYTDVILAMMDIEERQKSFLCYKTDRKPFKETDDENLEHLSEEELLMKLALADIDERDEESIHNATERTYCCETENKNSLLLSKIWCRDMVIQNKLISVLSEMGLVKIIEGTNELSSATENYLKRNKIVTNDPHFSDKANSFCSKIKTEMKRKRKNDSESWINTALWSIGFEDFDERSIFCTSDKIFFSSYKIGKEITKDQMYDLISFDEIC